MPKSASSVRRDQLSDLHEEAEAIMHCLGRFTKVEFVRELRRLNLDVAKSGYRTVETFLKKCGCQKIGEVFVYDEVSALQEKCRIVAKELGRFTEDDFVQVFINKFKANDLLSNGKPRSISSLLFTVDGIGCVRNQLADSDTVYYYNRRSSKAGSDSGGKGNEFEKEDSEAVDNKLDLMDFFHQRRRYHRKVDSILLQLKEFGTKDFAERLIEYYIDYYDFKSVRELLESRGCTVEGSKYSYSKSSPVFPDLYEQGYTGHKGIVKEKDGFSFLVDQVLYYHLRTSDEHEFPPGLCDKLASYYTYRSTEHLLRLRGCLVKGERFSYKEKTALKRKAAIVAEQLKTFSEEMFVDEFRYIYDTSLKWKKVGFASVKSLLLSTRQIAISTNEEGHVTYTYRRRKMRAEEWNNEDDINVELSVLTEEQEEKARQELKSKIAWIARRRRTIFEHEIDDLYEDYFAEPINPRQCGFETNASLLQSIPELDWVNGGRYRIKPQLSAPSTQSWPLDLKEKSRWLREVLKMRTLRVARELREFRECDISSAYKRIYKRNMNLRECGFYSVIDLLEAIDELEIAAGGRIRVREELDDDPVGEARQRESGTEGMPTNQGNRVNTPEPSNYDIQEIDVITLDDNEKRQRSINQKQCSTGNKSSRKSERKRSRLSMDDEEDARPKRQTIHREDGNQGDRGESRCLRNEGSHDGYELK